MLAYVPNLAAPRALALAASSSRFRGGAVVCKASRRRVAAPATSASAKLKACSLALEGLLKPLIFLTNCIEDARTSSGVTGGSKLKRFLIFLHMQDDLKLFGAQAPRNHIGFLS